MIYKFTITFNVLFLSTVACLADPPSVLIRVEQDAAIVELVEGPNVELAVGQTGLIVWADGDRECWQMFTTSWHLPKRGSIDAFEFDLASFSRSGNQHSPSSNDLIQATTLLAQVRPPEITRGGGRIITPYAGANLLNPKLTLRRDRGNGDKKLSAQIAIVMRGKEEVIRIPFKEGQSEIYWDAIEDVPEQLKSGLPTGSYQLRLQNSMGLEVVRFAVQGTNKRDELLHNEELLSQLLQETKHPLYVQVAVEKLIEQQPPYLCDALDLLAEIPGPQRTSRLAALRQHVLERLKDPDQKPDLPYGLGQPTGDPVIDEVRSFIAANQWGRALRKLDDVEFGDSRESHRQAALVQLYRGVILSESGSGKEQEAAVAFTKAIAMLEAVPNGQADLFRAHNNFANFLLGRVQDRLHNHAFQMAAGVRLPLLTALQDWSEARQHYEQALKLAESPQQKTAVQLNLARQYAVLADVIHTLTDPKYPEQCFDVAENAASMHAGKLAKDIVDRISVDKSDPLVMAIAQELLAQLAFRKGNVSSAESYCKQAFGLYLDYGSLIGLESATRLLGLCMKDHADRQRADGALQQFLISEQLSEILRDRYPPDQIGLSRAGFFARRAYITEHIVDLLITQDRDAEALFHIEKDKARAFQDTLTARSIVTEPIRLFASKELHSDWPNGVVALEYFLGSDRAWIFVVESDGNVNAHSLNDKEGKPIASRLLVSRIQKFISYLDMLGPGTHARAGEGRRIANGGNFDWSWQDELHSLFHTLIPANVLSEIRDAQKCLIIPHHILHYFPFAALVTKLDTRDVDPTSMPLPSFLIDESFDIAYAPSITAWRTLRQKKNRPIERVQAIGVADFLGHLKSLPGVNKELLNLRETFAPRLGEILTDDMVTIVNASRLLTKSGILVIATHGMKEPDNPLDSFFVCYGEHGGVAKLTAADLYSMPVNSDLVILNACYGGFGDRSPMPSDDLYGVQRALLHAGARTVISGLWDIYDATAPDLMRDVYRQLADGDSAVSALAKAQRNYLSAWRAAPQEPLRFLTHPYYWAVFTVIGDDRTGASTEQVPSYETSDPPEAKLPANPVNDELKALQGIWLNESYQFAENENPRRFASFRVQIQGDTWTRNPGKGETRYRISIDPIRDPKHLDLYEVRHDGSERILRCLYEIKDGKLIVCRQYHTVDPARPSKIVAGNSFGVSIWKHETKQDKATNTTATTLAASQSVEPTGSRKHVLSEDPAFSQFVDLGDVARAAAELDAPYLADLALQTAERERVLGRPCKLMSAQSLRSIALSIAALNDDSETIERLKRVSEKLGNESVMRDIEGAEQIVSNSRGGGHISVRVAHVTPEAFRAISELVRDIRLATVTGDLSRLSISEGDLATVPGLEDAEKEQIQQLLSDARGGILPTAPSIPLPAWVNRMSVGVEILVNGKPLPVIQHRGQSYVVVPKLGVEYTIRVVNRGQLGIVANAAVDGLSVMNGLVASENGSGYIIQPNSSYTILGWRRGSEQVAAFRFESPEKSYAVGTGRLGEIGTIRLVVFEEQPPLPVFPHNTRPPSVWGTGSIGNARSFGGPASLNLKQPSAGTGYGRELDSTVVGVAFRRSNNKRVINLVYDTKEALAKAGVPLEDFTPAPPISRSSSGDDLP